MLNRLKEWVVSKTIQHAESRFSIFVWMRQVNDRLLRLEDKDAEQAVQQRAETEAKFDAKLQTVEGKIATLDSKIDHLETLILPMGADNGV